MLGTMEMAQGHVVSSREDVRRDRLDAAHPGQRSLGVAQRTTRDEENDADRRGLRNAIATGYDGTAMLTFFERLEKTEKEKPSSLEVYFLTHPPTGERIRSVLWMERMERTQWLTFGLPFYTRLWQIALLPLPALPAPSAAQVTAPTVRVAD